MFLAAPLMVTVRTVVGLVRRFPSASILGLPSALKAGTFSVRDSSMTFPFSSRIVSKAGFV